MENTNNKSKTNNEHIMVGLSSSPSNAKIIETAAEMAKAFNASLTAVYVKQSKDEKMNEDNSLRLQENIQLAKKLGASVTTIVGENVPLQLAEFARISSVSKIVIGRSAATKKTLFGKLTLADNLIALASNVDIYIIPDNVNIINQQKNKLFAKINIKLILKELLISLALLVVCTGFGYLFNYLGLIDSTIITIYVLGVLITSVITSTKICWFFSSIMSVLIFNFLFIEPIYSLRANDSSYPFTFAVMLIASIVTGSLATKFKNQAKQSSKAAYRTKILFDANQLLHNAESINQIYEITANQLNILLNRFVIICKVDGQDIDTSFYGKIDDKKAIFDENDKQDVINITKHIDNDLKSRWSFFNIETNKDQYGVIGIYVKDLQLDSFEQSIVSSIIGECALAIENNINENEKELALVLAKNEQLRANLLRSISHDLRTPLTSIYGNANNLLSNSASFDKKTKTQIYKDIMEDSMWLMNLTENLLSITRLVDGKIKLNITSELVDEVIEEALLHINRKSVEHNIIFNKNNSLILAKMDARLIIQVVINIVDNAIKYSPINSNIEINSSVVDNMVWISISDNGNGISDENKENVFEMFYTGNNKVADSRRGLGLGLALCKSIVDAHGGVIKVEDNNPHGTIFSFSLPLSEVKIYE